MQLYFYLYYNQVMPFLDLIYLMVGIYLTDRPSIIQEKFIKHTFMVWKKKQEP